MDGHPSNCPSVEKPRDRTAPQSTTKRDFLSMPLEELMQISIAAVSVGKNNNFLDMSIEELMKISVPGPTSKQQKQI